MNGMTCSVVIAIPTAYKLVMTLQRYEMAGYGYLTTATTTTAAASTQFEHYDLNLHIDRKKENK